MLSVYLQVQYFPQNLFIMLLAICQLHNSLNTYSELTCACSDKFKNWSVGIFSFIMIGDLETYLYSAFMTCVAQ